MNAEKRRGITLVELLVVLLIIGILSSIAVNVYIQRVTLARVAAAKAMIQQLETAIETYRVDVGQIPPSDFGSILAGNAGGVALDNNSFPATGNGYLFLALTRSLNGNQFVPLESRWRGPYIDVPAALVGTVTGAAPDTTTPLPSLNILDPWGNPYIYITAEDYASLGGTELPRSAFLFSVETYYNASSYQLISKGPNETTFDPPSLGLENDDITNFKNYLVP